MKIQYQKIENGLEILRIWQDSGIIKVPEQEFLSSALLHIHFHCIKMKKRKMHLFIRQRQMKRMIVLRSRKNSAVVE